MTPDLIAALTRLIECASTASKTYSAIPPDIRNSLKDCSSDAADALAAFTAAPKCPSCDGSGVDARLSLYRHLKTGGIYRLVRADGVKIERDWTDGVIYEAHDGLWIVREKVEFFDGRFEELPASPTPPEQTTGSTLKPNQIKHMVDRFLSWKLPQNFHPDAGISFKATFNGLGPYPMKHEPSGTNLFDVEQAEAMVRYMIDGMPGTAASPSSTPSTEDDAGLRAACGEAAAPPDYQELEDTIYRLTLMNRAGGLGLENHERLQKALACLEVLQPTLARLTRENEAMREALKFYANDDSWQIDGLPRDRALALVDQGDYARRALSSDREGR